MQIYAGKLLEPSIRKLRAEAMNANDCLICVLSLGRVHARVLSWLLWSIFAWTCPTSHGLSVRRIMIRLVSILFYIGSCDLGQMPSGVGSLLAPLHISQDLHAMIADTYLSSRCQLHLSISTMGVINARSREGGKVDSPDNHGF